MRIEPFEVADMPEEQWEEIHKILQQVNAGIDEVFATAINYKELNDELLKVYMYFGLISGDITCKINIGGGD